MTIVQKLTCCVNSYAINEKWHGGGKEKLHEYQSNYLYSNVTQL